MKVQEHFNRLQPGFQPSALASNDERAEFERVCRPVVEFIQKQGCGAHIRVLIDWSSAVLLQDLRGVGFKVPD